MTLAVPKPGPIQDATGGLTRPWLDFIQALARQAAAGGDDAAVLAATGSTGFAGISASVNLAKLTTGGAAGSLLVSGGIIVAYSPPT